MRIRRGALSVSDAAGPVRGSARRGARLRGAELAQAPSPVEVVSLAGSAGGIDALLAILPRLPRDFPAAILVQEHLGPRSELVSILRARCSLRIRWAASGGTPEPGVVDVAPPRRTLRVEADGSLDVAPDACVRPGFRCAADTLLASAADRFGAHAVSVVLSGSGEDGASGVRATRRAGGASLVQDEASCSCRFMPDAALATGCVDRSVPVQMIAPTLVSLVRDGAAIGDLRTAEDPDHADGRGSPDCARALDQLLSFVTAAHQTDLGDVHLLAADSTSLALVAQRGLSLGYMGDFHALSLGDGTATGAAARGVRSTQDDSAGDSARFRRHRAASTRAGFQSACSYPLLLRGRVMGAVTARFRGAANRLSSREAGALEVRIRFATDGIERHGGFFHRALAS